MSYMDENTFKAVKRRKFKQRMELLHTEHLAKGQVIYRKGNPVKYVFRVKTGSVKLVNTWRNQQCIIQHIINEGQYFGILDFFTSTERRRLTAYANDKRTFLERLPVKEFEAKFKNQSEFANEIWTSIGKLRMESEWKFDIYLLETIEERLINCLLRQAQIQGINTPSGVKFPMLTHWEYGEYLGMSRQSITMLLNRLKRKQKIDYDRNTITVKKELMVEYQQKLKSNLTL